MSFLGLVDVAQAAAQNSVPGLGAAFAAAGALGQAISQLKIYKEQCKNLHTNAVSLLIKINDELSNDVESDALRNAASELEAVLIEIQKETSKWNNMGRLKSFITKDEIRQSLDKLQGKLQTVTIHFTVATHMEHARQQEIQRHLARSIADSQAQDMAHMKEMLRSIITNQEDLNAIQRLRPQEVQTIMHSLQTELRESNQGGRTTSHPNVYKEGLKEIRRRTGVLPPIADLTGEVKKTGNAPFETGATADVWLGEWLGEEVALKALRNIGKMDPRTARYFAKEIEIWRSLQHENVLPLYGRCYMEPFEHLVSPYATNRDALTYLKTHPDADRLKLIANVSSGLAYLHTRPTPVIHGDLRAANIVIMKDGNARICDFGLSRLEEMAENVKVTSWNAVGACRWMAPEIVDPPNGQQPIPTTATDVWSFALAAYEIFTERRPYEHRTLDVHVAQDIVRGWRHPRPRGTVESRGLSDEVWLTLERCWNQEPARRPSASELANIFNRIAHPHYVAAAPSRSPTGDLVDENRRRSFTSRSSDVNANPGPSLGSGSQNLSVRTSGRFYASPKQLPLMLEEQEDAHREIFDWSDIVAGLSSDETPPPPSHLQPLYSANSAHLSTPLPGPSSSYFAGPSSMPNSANSFASTFSPTSPFTPSSSYGRRNDTVLLTPTSPQQGFRQRQIRPNTAESIAESMFSARSTTTQLSSFSIDTSAAAPCGPLEVKLSTDGRMVEAGTLDGLLAFMVNAEASYGLFRRTFFTTYRVFAKDSDLFAVLQDNYIKAQHSSTQERIRVRLRVVDILTEWLEFVDLKHRDPIVLSEIKEFGKSITEPVTIATKAQIMVTIVRTMLGTHGPIARRPSNISRSTHSSGEDVIPLGAIPPQDVASHLNIIRSRMYQAIKISDCVDHFERKAQSDNTLIAFYKTSDQIIGWVQKLILKGKTSDDRAKIMGRWITSAKACLDMGNFQSMCSIVVALNSVVISRLTVTNGRVNVELKRTWAQMTALLDHNFQNYRKAVKEFSGPKIPVLIVHMSDVKHIYNKSEPTVPGTSEELINFSRYNKLVEGLKKVLDARETTQPLDPNPAYLRCIERQINSMHLDDRLNKWLEDESAKHSQQEKSNWDSRRDFRHQLGFG